MNKAKTKIALLLFCLIIFKVDALSPRMNTPALKPDLGKICIGCHKELEKELSKGKWVHRPSKLGDCISCHTPHAAKYKDLLAITQEELCFGCHEAQKVWIGAKVKHEPVEFGQCVNCHRPHVSAYDNLLKEEGKQLCYTCHDKSGFGKSNVHSPVDKGMCGQCHSSHCADLPFLLIKPVPDICSKCHRSISKHDMIDKKNSDCLQCHNPHSSERENLLYTVSHKPYARGRCEECHQKRSGKIIKAQGNANLCYGCHKDFEKKVQDKKTHIVEGPRECTFCHNPHGSERKDLVRGRDGPLCISCHDGIGIRLKTDKDVMRHPEVIAKRCSTCHDSHASMDIRFLKEDLNTICLSCHERQKVFFHPMGEKVYDPRTKTPIGCVTCHNPMGTKHSYLLRLSGEEALCKQCHKNY